MNKITKKSFYSFLALYLVSSFLFLSLAAYWFFTSQLAMEMNNNFYKMTQIADRVSANVIQSDMKGEQYKLKPFPMASVALVDKKKNIIDGTLQHEVDYTKKFYMAHNSFTLVSDKPSGHLGVAYVVVQSNQCNQNVAALKKKVITTVILTAIFIIVIAALLSYIFLRPIREKMQEIDSFVKDTTHELNTPITALMMSTSRLKKREAYDAKIVQNISISTKQLHDIYESLSFLSFDTQSEVAQELDFSEVVTESIMYFKELLEKKKLTITSDLQPCLVTIAPTKAKMLVNNLLSNSIKYSKPNKKITLITTPTTFTIIDEGIGIAKEKLDNIFKRFVRANSYAGGFGVGLNIVESIITEYGFAITLESQESLGTTITIDFKDI